MIYLFNNIFYTYFFPLITSVALACFKENSQCPSVSSQTGRLPRPLL